MSDTQRITDSSFVIHSVPVFQKDLAAVYKLLADRNPDAGPLRPLPAATAASVEDIWTEANLVALFGMCKTVHRAILTRMAEQLMARRVTSPSGGAADAGAAVKAARADAKTSLRKRGGVYWATRAITGVMYLDVLLWGRFRSGPFFARLRKRPSGKH